MQVVVYTSLEGVCGVVVYTSLEGVCGVVVVYTSLEGVQVVVVYTSLEGVCAGGGGVYIIGGCVCRVVVLYMYTLEGLMQRLIQENTIITVMFL